MDKPPDFFLTTAGESTGLLLEPRACCVGGRLKDAIRDDYMLVEIDPPLIGQSYGLGGNDITVLLLSTRSQGQTLFPFKELPLSVYVSRILDESILETLEFAATQVELIAWGYLYRSLEEAVAAAKKFQPYV